MAVRGHWRAPLQTHYNRSLKNCHRALILCSARAAADGLGRGEQTASRPGAAWAQRRGTSEGPGSSGNAAPPKVTFSGHRGHPGPARPGPRARPHRACAHVLSARVTAATPSAQGRLGGPLPITAPAHTRAPRLRAGPQLGADARGTPSTGVPGTTFGPAFWKLPRGRPSHSPHPLSPVWGGRPASLKLHRPWAGEAAPAHRRLFGEGPDPAIPRPSRRSTAPTAPPNWKVLKRRARSLRPSGFWLRSSLRSSLATPLPLRRLPASTPCQSSISSLGQPRNRPLIG